MRMASFGVASLLIIVLVACSVSISVAQTRTTIDCSGNDDCALTCRGRGGGVCDPKTGKCVCNQLPSNVVPVVDAKCEEQDPDCSKFCPPNCKIHNCNNGFCFCDQC